MIITNSLWFIFIFIQIKYDASVIILYRLLLELFTRSEMSPQFFSVLLSAEKQGENNRKLCQKEDLSQRNWFDDISRFEFMMVGGRGL